MIDIIEHKFQKGIDLSNTDKDVLSVYGQLHRDDEKEDDIYELSLKEEFMGDGSRCYVLLHDDAVAAVANYQSQHIRKESYLHTIVVDKQKRKLGLGTTMMQFLIEKTVEDGNRLLSLDAVRNHIGFYARLGFVITADDPAYPEMVKYV